MSIAPARARLTDRSFRDGLGAALGAFVLIRVLGLAMLASGASAGGFTLADRLASWDGQWYLRIAQFGYPGVITLTDPQNDASGRYAFPGGYPWLMRVVNWFGLSYEGAGILISWIAAIVAAAGIYYYLSRLANQRAAVIAVALWAGMPMAITLSMVYTEALFVALAIWALYALLDDRWLLAGTLGLLSGLVRVHGLAVGLAICGVAIVWCRAQRSASRWRPIVGSIFGLAGVPLWWLFVAVEGGRIDGWFVVQSHFWGNGFDFGAAFVTELWKAVTFSGLAEGQDASGTVVYFVTIAGLVAALLVMVNLFQRARADSTWLAPALYTLGVLGLTIGSAGYLHSKLRYLVPVVPLLFPLAIVLARSRRLSAIGTVVIFALCGAWWSTFTLVVWKYAI